MFNKKPDKMCMLCEHAKILRHADVLICAKKGVVREDAKCGGFRYDPLKRTPKKTVFTHDFDESDFTIADG